MQIVCKVVFCSRFADDDERVEEEIECGASRGIDSHQKREVAWSELEYLESLVAKQEDGFAIDLRHHADTQC